MKSLSSLDSTLKKLTGLPLAFPTPEIAYSTMLSPKFIGLNFFLDGVCSKS